MDYTISRLIKGLVSNRKCARIGYAATLGTVRNLSKNKTHKKIFFYIHFSLPVFRIIN